MALDLAMANGEYVGLPDVTALEIAGQISLMCWAKLTSTGLLRNIIAKGVGSGEETWLRMRVGDNLDIGTWTLATGDTRASHVLTGSELTDWTHFAGVYDGATWRLYINAVEEATNTNVQGARACAGSAWSIGRKTDSNNRFFDGTLDDARLYDRGLSANEIKTIFASRGHDGIVQSLVARYQLNEKEPGATASGAGVVKDVGPNGLDGTPANTPTYAASELSFRRSLP